MQHGRESWAKIGTVTSIAVACGGIYFGLLQAACGLGGFVKDVLSIVGIGMVGGICSLAFRRQSRRYYLATLVGIVIVLLSAVLWMRFYLKPAITTAFSGVVFSQNSLAPGYSKTKEENGLDKVEKFREYWRHY